MGFGDSRTTDYEVSSELLLSYLAYQFSSAMCRWCHGGEGNTTMDPGTTGMSKAVLNLGFLSLRLNLFPWSSLSSFWGCFTLRGSFCTLNSLVILDFELLSAGDSSV